MGSSNINHINLDCSQIASSKKELQMEEMKTNLVTPKLERLLPVGIIFPDKGYIIDLLES